MNGAMMLACEIASVVCACPRKSRASSSRPTRNMNSTTPIFATIARCGAAAGGIKNAYASGEIAPSTDGPSMMPATISPITGGCRRCFSNARPTSRAQMVITASARSTCASRSEGGAAAPLRVTSGSGGAINWSPCVRIKKKSTTVTASIIE
jgi:hypothetical protein